MHHYSVPVSSSFIAATLLLAVIVAFSGGVWVAKRQQEGVALSSKSTNTNAAFDNRSSSQPLYNNIMLPTSSSSTKDDDKEHVAHPTVDGDGNGDSHKDRTLHYLVDIVSRDDNLLQSKERILNVVFQLIDALEIGPAVSQHCHEPISLPTSAGVHCIVLMQKLGHVSILTWPKTQTIYLDIFSEALDETEVKATLTLLQSKFKAWTGPPTSSAPQVKWSLQKRGFGTVAGAGVENLDDFEVDLYVLGASRHTLKEFVAQEMSDFQAISVFNIIDPKVRPGLEDYVKSLQNDGSYQSLHPDLFRPDRIIYLDGIMQSRLMGEAAYHEALVQAVLLMHPNPKRVAIIGGGEGATLREVLKHRTVEHVAMIDIDKRMVEICIKYLPEWNSCGNLVGSAPLCFDDPRASIFYEDAVAWFVQRFRDEDNIDPNQRYDVIIMDVLDPSSDTPFSDYLYSNEDFTMALSSSMNANGVLVSQVGESDNGEELAHHLRKKKGLAIFMSLLKKYGFKSLDMYEESHGGLLGIWLFLMAWKDFNHRTMRWDSNQAMLDLELQRRLKATTTDDESGTPLKFVDGATLVGYQFPPRPLQNTACRNLPTPAFCAAKCGLDPERPHAPSSLWRVLSANETLNFFSADAPLVALLARGNVSKGSLLAVDARVQDIVMSAKTMELIERMSTTVAVGKNLTKWEALVSYIHVYGTHCAGHSGEYSVATSAISLLLTRQASSVQDTGNTAVASLTIPFRRNAKTLQNAVWTTLSIDSGETIVAETLGR